MRSSYLLLSWLLLGFCIFGATHAYPSSTDNLTIVISKSAAGGTYTLTCNPTGGNHPDSQEACAHLNRAKSSGQDLFAPKRTDEVCCAAAFGPEMATVTGTWNGKSINAKFARNDCCQESRWKALGELVRFAEIAVEPRN